MKHKLILGIVLGIALVGSVAAQETPPPMDREACLAKVRSLANRVNQYLRTQGLDFDVVSTRAREISEDLRRGYLTIETWYGPDLGTDQPWKRPGFTFMLYADGRCRWNASDLDLAFPDRKPLTRPELIQRYKDLWKVCGRPGEARVAMFDDKSGPRIGAYICDSGVFWDSMGFDDVEPLFGLPGATLPFDTKVRLVPKLPIAVGERQAMAMAQRLIASEFQRKNLKGIRLALPYGPSFGDVPEETVRDEDGELFLYLQYGKMRLYWNSSGLMPGSGLYWQGNWPIVAAADPRDQAFKPNLGGAEVQIDAVSGEVLKVLVVMNQRTSGFGSPTPTPTSRKTGFRWDRLGPLKSVVVGGKTLKAGGEIGGTGPWVTGRRIAVMLVFAKSLVPAEYDGLSQTFIVESGGREVFGKAPAGIAEELIRLTKSGGQTR